MRLLRFMRHISVFVFYRFLIEVLFKKLKIISTFQNIKNPKIERKDTNFHAGIFVSFEIS